MSQILKRLIKNPYLLLVIVCVAIYYPILGHYFQMRWDDQSQVFNRFTEGGLTFDNLRPVFTQFINGQYSPINSVFYIVIYSLFGYNPSIYHLFSLLLHIANCCLMFLFLSHIAAVFKPRIKASTIAFAGALLFAIHPLQVESISWISASKIPLYTFFTLLSFIAYIHYINTQKMRFYIAAFVCFVCSFGSKEQAVVLPVLLLLLDWAFGRYDKSDIKGSILHLLVEKLPFILFAVFAGLITVSQQNVEHTLRVAGYPLWQRLVFACYSLVVYAGRFIFPAGLLYLYPFPMTPGDAMPLRFFMYPAIIITLIAFAIYYIRKIPKLVIFGVLFYLINLALSLHIFPMSRFMITADRYVYLGSAGLFFIAAWYAAPWLQKMIAEKKKWSVIITACYMLYLGGYAHARTYAWKDNET